MANRTKLEVASLKAKSLARSFSNVMRKRYPWLMFWLLLLWVPAAMLLPMQAITANALLLDSYLQLLVLTVLNTMAIVFCIGLIRLMKNRIGITKCLPFLKLWVGDGTQPWGVRQLVLVVMASLVTPFCIACWSAAEFSGVLYGTVQMEEGFSSLSHLVLSFIAIAAGIVTTYFLLNFAGWVKTYLVGSDERTANFFPFEAIDRKGKFRFAENLHQWEYSVDVQLVIYTLVLAVLHILAVNLAPSISLVVASAPAVSVVLIWVGGLVVSGLSYWLDQIRIPAAVVLLLVALIVQGVMPKPAVLKTSAGNQTSNLLASELAAVFEKERDALSDGSDRAAAVMDATEAMDERTWQALLKRIGNAKAKDQSVGKTLVVVTCPGGGIHAAAWASCVLESISERYSNFSGSVCVISGVSGGSVGTLHFVSSEYSDLLGRDDPKVKPNAFESASTSSLEQISFGMMTDDLYGAFLPPLSLTDRGQRLEQSLLDRLPKKQRNMTLGDWGEHALTGKMPIAIFNATDAVTGRRILFDSLPTPRRRSGVGSTSRPLNYRELLAYKSGDNVCLDVSPASGARASATFPYVSPFTKPANASEVGSAVAIGDGGYVDNEGIVTAVEWIEFILTRWNDLPKEDRPFKRILLLRVTPSTSEDSFEIPSSKNALARLRWLSGPLETMVSVRSTSQIDRGNLESDLAALYLQSPENSTLSSTDVGDQDSLPQKEVSLATVKTELIFNRARNKAASDKYRRRLGLSSPMKEGELNAQSTELPANILIENQDEPDAMDDERDQRPVGAVFGPKTKSVFDRPVLIKSIEFQSDREGLTIPLNWKLSREQKEWYPDAWNWNVKNDAELMWILDGLFLKR
jgi:hypothetical protein